LLCFFFFFDYALDEKHIRGYKNFLVFSNIIKVKLKLNTPRALWAPSLCLISGLTDVHMEMEI